MTEACEISPQYTTQLVMIWPKSKLKTPVEIKVPEGYELRTYKPGDEKRFYEIMELSTWSGWNDTKLAEWIQRIPPNSWCMVVHTPTQEIAATAMGLHDHTDWHPFGGELGWLGSDPKHRGHGLGQVVSSAVVARLVQAGYSNIHLYTENFRSCAIKTYLKTGFIPYFYQDDMPKRWHDICEKLAWPFTLEEWQAELTN